MRRMIFIRVLANVMFWAVRQIDRMLGVATMFFPWFLEERECVIATVETRRAHWLDMLARESKRGVETAFAKMAAYDPDAAAA